MVGKAFLKKLAYAPLRDAWLRIRRPDYWKQKQTQLHFYTRLIPKRSLCFDIGANVGNYTELLLQAGARRVVAVEPQAACVNDIRQRFIEDRRVTLVPAAVGSTEGMVKMYASDASQIASCSKEWID